MSIEIALERIINAEKSDSSILDLSNLGLKEIPSEITKIVRLTHLFLSGNRISDLGCLEKLIYLKVLSLDFNQIKTIPRFLLDLDIPFLWEEMDKSLLSLRDEAQNQTKKLIKIRSVALINAKFRPQAQNVVQYLSQIEKVVIDIIKPYEYPFKPNPSIGVRIPDELDIEFTTVQFNNKLRTLSSTLDGSFKEIYHIAYQLRLYLEQLKNEVIDKEILKNVQIHAQELVLTIERAISKALEKCQFIDSGISDSIKNGIYVKANPIQTPPPEIIQQGNIAIGTFLEDLVEKEYLNEVKLILVGEGGAGKTSLVKRILGSDFDVNEQQTHGVKIVKHEFEYKGQDFQVNFWDFGGQEIMHATHQFFLTKRCLYVLVLDSRKDEKAEYWLSYIQSFGSNAPVIIVLNKIDQNPSFDVNRQFLNKKYNNIQSYYRLSCANGEGVSKLKKDILGILWKLELRNTELPKNWFKVKQHIETMEEDYMNYSKFQLICQQSHVLNTQSQKVLLDLLNDLGVVLNYEQLRLYDTQVLNPLWLTNAVYRIINSPILARTKGKFNINDLAAIINDPRYQRENPEHWVNIFRFWVPSQKTIKFPEEKFLFIVAMMKQFEILFQIDDHQYLIPELLSDEENIYPFNGKAPTLSFMIEYEDFLPPAIIPRLMVKLHKYIYNDQIWKTGMVLEEKLIFNSIANVILDKESRKINIEIEGKRSRDFLTVIRETIKEINRSYQDLNVIEWVPLPKLQDGERVLVDYKELLGYESAQQTVYFSGKLRLAFSVADLLDGIEKPEMRYSSIPCHIYISYAYQDMAFKEELLKHLSPLIRLKRATVWDNTSINAGEEWEEQILDNLAKADIVLCLISSSFISSDFCYSRELNLALKSHLQGLKKVIPVKIKEVNWSHLPIAKIQSIPKNDWVREINDNRSWTEISKEIENVINIFRKT